MTGIPTEALEFAMEGVEGASPNSQIIRLAARRVTPYMRRYATRLLRERVAKLRDMPGVEPAVAANEMERLASEIERLDQLR